MNRLFLFAVVLCIPLVAFGGKNPSDYPLKVHILQQSWASHNNRFNEFKGTGRGNLWDGDSVHAFDFSYECLIGVRRTARNQPYLAKWKKPNLRLALLSPEIGKNDKYQECELKTTVHHGVYIVGAGGISEYSQQEFNDWKQKHSASGAPQVDASSSRLSVSSRPDGAEIEVDGEFMGNTPSVLDLGPGDHSVAVRKTGFKPWEKHIKLTGGEINLNAELEPDASR